MNKLYLVPLFSVLLFACDQVTEPVTTEQEQTEIVTENVLAKVNGEPITEFQLDWAINRTLGDSAALYADGKLYEKMLQSLISSRSMSLLAEKQLGQEETALLDEKVRSYREELLVKQYLQANTTVEPVTTEQVQQYYDNHPEEFGADLVKEFELIVSVGKLSASDKAKLLKEFEFAKSQKDWSVWANKLSQQAYPVTYKKAKSQLSLLSTAIQKLIANTPVNKTSEVYFGEQLIIARVISETKLEAKPLSQVSIEIRKKLAPVNMKKALKEASELAGKKVKVEIN